MKNKREQNESISWYQELDSGITRKGKDNFSNFNNVGLGNVNSFAIWIRGRRINFTCPLIEVSISKVQEMNGRGSKTIGICIKGKLDQTKELCYWSDEKEMFIFHTNDAATNRSFSKDEKVLVEKGYFKLIVELENNRVELCQY